MNISQNSILNDIRKNGILRSFQSPVVKVSIGILLLATAAFLSLVILDFDSGRYLVAYGGYYICFALFLLFLFTGYRAHGSPVGKWKNLLHKHRWPLLLCVVLAGALHLHEPHMMRVYFDEPTHLMVSLRMHEDRLATIPSRAHYDFGSLIFLDNNPSFRSVFFPFLVSIVHDLTGYRIANAYIVNFIATLFLLVTVYGLGFQLRGKWLGTLGCLLLATLPLLAVTATSAGYDTTNLLFFALFTYAGLRYARSGGERNLSFFVMSGLVLAATRNESLLYLGVIPLMVLFRWIKYKQLELSWLSVLSPLFLAYAYAFKIILNHIEGAVPKALRDRGVGFFAAEFIPVNFPKVGNFLFSFNTVTANSFLLSTVGVISLLFFFVLLGSLAIRRKLFDSNERIFLLFITLTGIGLFLLVLSHFWETTESQAIRLLLPIHLTGILALYAWNREIRLSDRILRWSCLVTATFFFLFTIPTNGRSFLTNQGIVANTHRVFYDYVEKQDQRRTLYVLQSPLSALMLKLPATGIARANADPEALMALVKSGLYSEIIFFETLMLNHAGPEFLRAEQATAVSEQFVREEVARSQRFLTGIGLITRLVGIVDEEGREVLLEDFDYKRPVFESRQEFRTYLQELLP